MDRDLEPVLVLIEQALDFEEVILIEGVDGIFDVVPHLGFDLAATVGENQRQVRLSALLGLDLLGTDDKSGGDDLVFEAGTIREEEIFHDFSLASLGKAALGRDPTVPPSLN